MTSEWVRPKMTILQQMDASKGRRGSKSSVSNAGEGLLGWMVARLGWCYPTLNLKCAFRMGHPISGCVAMG